MIKANGTEIEIKGSGLEITTELGALLLAFYTMLEGELGSNKARYELTRITESVKKAITAVGS